MATLYVVSDYVEDSEDLYLTAVKGHFFRPHAFTTGHLPTSENYTLREDSIR